MRKNAELSSEKAKKERKNTFEEEVVSQMKNFAFSKLVRSDVPKINTSLHIDKICKFKDCILNKQN